VSYTHTQLFNGLLCGTVEVCQYQKKYLPTHNHEEEKEGFAQTTLRLFTYKVKSYVNLTPRHVIGWLELDFLDDSVDLF